MICIHYSGQINNNEPVSFQRKNLRSFLYLIGHMLRNFDTFQLDHVFLQFSKMHI